MTSFSYAAVLVVLSIGTADALGRLPSAKESGKDTESLEREGSWWFRVGDDVYHKPEPARASLLELGQHVSDYYHAMGSPGALTEEMNAHRVGGSGRQHIFYLPDGPSTLKDIRHNGPRRSSFSMLTQLKSGVVLGNFPKYQRSGVYQHPLALAHQSVERSAVMKITEEGVMSYLRQLTSFPNADRPTRSWTNAEASQQVESWLHGQLQSMGYATCMNEFHQGGMDLANIVAFKPGRTSETVTVGAHYDSRPFTGRAPGANDNGSGTAALLAMAKAFAESNVVPEKSVYFVLFAAEEPGLWGSEHFAKVLLRGSGLPAKCSTAASKASSFLSGGKVQASGHKAIIMDEIGWKSPRSTRPMVNMESYDWSHDVLEHLAQSSLTHNGDALEIEHSNNPFGSDHMSYLDKGMKAVLTINFDDEGYPDYHKSTDSIKNVDPQLLTLVTRMNMGGLLRMTGVSATI